MNANLTLTSTVASADGTAIAYDKVGTGPAVILVGGAFQYRSFDPRTAEIAAALSDRFTVFHYDRRGRGDSGDTQPYAVAREVEDIAALIEAAGGRAHLYGMSSGAPLALDAVAAGLDVPKIAGERARNPCVRRPTRWPHCCPTRDASRYPGRIMVSRRTPSCRCWPRSTANDADTRGHGGSGSSVRASVPPDDVPMNDR